MAMCIEDALLTPNQFSRPQHRLPEVLGVVVHYLGVPKQTARQCRNYFEGLKNQDVSDNIPDRSASTHFIIDLDGTVLQCIPLNEKAYHCGSSTLDPASGKVYTDLARSLFGKYAALPRSTSPNSCTIGIELAHLDANGTFDERTIRSAVRLVAMLCKRYSLDPRTQVLRHYDVVGWKPCPLLWVNEPKLFDAFKEDIALQMAKETI